MRRRPSRLTSLSRPADRVAKVNLPLHRFALSTAFSTLCLIIAGALVTSNEAGLSVPDWPLSYGQLMPPMIGGIFYEHGHRMIASFVGLLTIVLAGWLWKAETRGWIKKLGLAAILAVIAQGVLGGLTVIFLLPVAISVSHACLAQLFFCMIVSLAWFTSPSWHKQHEELGPRLPDRGAPSLRSLCLTANVAVFLQLMMGAALRHKGFGIIPHLIGAVVVAALLVWILSRLVTEYPGRPEILRWALMLNGMVMLQLVLGAGTYWIREITEAAAQPLLPMVLLTVAHVAAGALILAVSVILSIQVHARLDHSTADMGKQRVPAAT